MEIWKDVKGYEGYYRVSNLGNIYSLPRKWECGISVRNHNGVILRQFPDNRGYLQVTLNKCGKRSTKKVHKLVAEAFIIGTKSEINCVIDHINDNKTDNRIDNLHYVSYRYNAFKTQGKYSSRYKGVQLNKSTGKWKAYIYHNGKTIHLGYFVKEEEARDAYIQSLSKIKNGEM